MLSIHAGDENMPKRKYDCETCGTKDLSKNEYYREHHKGACLAAAVAALRQCQAPAADGPPAHLDAMEAHEGGEQGEVPGSDQHLGAAHEPAESVAAAPEAESGAGDDFTANEPYCQPLERLFGDAEAFAAACQHIVPAEDAGPCREDPAVQDPAASAQGPEAYAPEAAAPHDPELQVFEDLQPPTLTEEAAQPIELDHPDAQLVYAAPEDQQFQGERPGDAQADQSDTRPGTAAYYAAHRHDKLYAGSELTVEQMCYLMLTQKQIHRQHDTAFDEQCRLHCDVVLPKPNKMPGSLYLMRKVSRHCWPPESVLHNPGMHASSCTLFVLLLRLAGGLRRSWVVITDRGAWLPHCHAHRTPCAELHGSHAMRYVKVH